ncbi:sensor histidine kinase [Nonomuraea sp. NPDC046570]|uniref:sensor histidine kinase n=1 Tax=Nonomuraea sp. NPDC046570 TaxID=3155255 RepID=UPI0033E4DB8B
MTASRVARPLRAPWTARAWLDTAHVVTGAAVALVTAPLTIVFLVQPRLWLRLVGAVTRLQRSRFGAFLGVHIPEVPRAGSFRQALHTRSTWRQVSYHLLSAPLGVAGAVVVAVTWTGGLVLALSFTHAQRVPPPMVFPLDYRDPVVAAQATASGLVLLLAAPWVARGMATLDVMMAMTLLGASREELTHRIESLRESRAGAVDAADAERRRIERDLHDGAQQRLVSLAMNLGLARATLTDLPEPAREALAQAHEEAKQALKELRDFVRGLHPAVLNDQGLDAALSGIAARSPLPVRLRVEISGQLPPTIETVAFFVVSEALTNIAKHAAATRAEVLVQRVEDVLTVTVLDDGHGGADLDGGSGLRGLNQRVASVDGVLWLDSPPGGPTRITAELPCE